MKYNTYDNLKGTSLLKELIEEVINKTDYFPISKNLILTVGTFKSTRILGNCKYNRVQDTYRIALNENLLNRGTTQQIKNVLIHELIHTMYDCMNHRIPFKTKAIYYKNLTGYDALSKDYKGILDKQQAKYIVKCDKCGEIVAHYKRKQDLSVRRCGMCHGTLSYITNPLDK